MSLLPLDDTWTWVNDSPENREVSGSNIVIRILKGGMWNENSSPKNLLLRPASKSAFSLETDLTMRPEVRGEQAGLVLTYSPRQYVKFNLEQLKDGVWAVLALTEAGASIVVSKFELPSFFEGSSEAHLRLFVSAPSAEGERSVRALCKYQEHEFEMSLQTPLRPESNQAEDELKMGLYATAYEETTRKAIFRAFMFEESL